MYVCIYCMVAPHAQPQSLVILGTALYGLCCMHALHVLLNGSWQRCIRKKPNNLLLLWLLHLQIIIDWKIAIGISLSMAGRTSQSNGKDRHTENLAQQKQQQQQVETSRRSQHADIIVKHKCLKITLIFAPCTAPCTKEYM